MFSSSLLAPCCCWFWVPVVAQVVALFKGLLDTGDEGTQAKARGESEPTPHPTCFASPAASRLSEQTLLAPASFLGWAESAGPAHLTFKDVSSFFCTSMP
uniref:Secreted protein n=1 Tax=Podarcis muralis TaxID=64176 RepID=A0A670K7F5_PODMU